MKKKKLKKKKKLPRLESREKFVQFVETHDLSEYWDEFKEVEPLKLDTKLSQAIDQRAHRKKLISIRLETWQIRLAKAVAARERIPYHTVIRRWVEEGIRLRRATS